MSTAGVGQHPPGQAQAGELAAFFDAFFAARLKQKGLYGAVCVLVRKGQVLLCRGYGYADPMTNRPLDVARATLPVASIAKALTATAVMQLVDRGELDLHADVNRYLQGVKLEVVGEPITIGHLLSHTEGFQERNLGIVALSPEQLATLGDFFRAGMPKPVIPPGQRITYGNWASGLLGLVIEQVTGKRFDQFVAESLFQPLGMAGSTFAQPPAPAIAERCIRECTPQKGGGYQEAPHVFAQMAPAGGMHTTGPDMGRYLIAMAGDGSCDGQRILSAAAVQAMHQVRFRPHPEMPGITYGFFEEFRNGRRVLRRDGDSVGAWSRIYLMPEEETGLFFLVAGSEEARHELTAAFFDRFYPAAERRGEPGAAGDVGQYAGIYRYVQHNRDTFTKLQTLFVGQIKVQAHPDGSLTVTALAAGDVYGGFEGTSVWQPAGNRLFRREDGNAQIAFGQDADGRVTQMYSSMRYMGSYDRLRWFEAAPFHMAFLVVSLLLFLGAAVLFGALPLFGVIGAGLPVAVMGLYGLLGAAFCGLLVPAMFLIGNVGGSFPAYGFGVNGWLRGTLTIPLITTPLTAALLWGSWAMWTAGTWGVGVQVFYSLVTAVACLLIWWVRHWNLLGYRW